MKYPRSPSSQKHLAQQVHIKVSEKAIIRNEEHHALENRLEPSNLLKVFKEVASNYIELKLLQPYACRIVPN